MNIIVREDIAKSLEQIKSPNYMKKNEVKRLSKNYLNNLKSLLNKEKIVEVTDIKCFNNKDYFIFSWKLLDIHSIEKVKVGVDIDNVLNGIVTKVKDELTLNTKYSYNIVNHQQRRHHLITRTKYLKEKNKMHFKEWCNLVTANIEEGRQRHRSFMNNVIKYNTELLVNREVSYRQLLYMTGVDGKDIEAKIEDWYTRMIKENSFMSEK